ncbi:MAG: hypothetical protein PT941_01510 [Bacillales bacterium]|nr:hypothetical protein [Bacillales bacterium]
MLLSNSFKFDIKEDYPFLLIVILTLSLIIFFIYIFAFNHKNKKDLSYITSGKNNIRLFTIHYEEKYVYVVDKKDFKGKREESFEWFYNGFANEDAIRVKVWIDEMIRKDKALKNNLEVYVNIKRNKNPIFSVLTCTGIDYENKVIHLESHLFPEIKGIKINSQSKDDQIKNYNSLSNYYYSLKNEKVNLYFIRVFSKEEKDNAFEWNKKVIMTLLISRIRKLISNTMKICLLKNNEIVILENHIGNKNKTIAFGHMISQEVAKILYLNTTQNVYLHKIGIATSRNNQSFEDLIKYAKEMTFSSDEENNLVIFNSSSENKDMSQELSKKINDIIINNQGDVEYTTIYNCINGHLLGFYSKLNIKNSYFNSFDEIQDYAYSYSQIDELIEMLYKKINSIYVNKYFITSEKRRLFLHTKIKYYQSILNNVNKINLLDNIKTVIVIKDVDINKEAISNNKFLMEALHALKNEHKIRIGLEFTSTSLEMSDEILKLFDYFIFDFNENFSNLLSSNQEQILIQNLVTTLFDYPLGKLLAVNLSSWQAIEYFASLGFKYVSGPIFGHEVNKIPPVDTKKINKLLSINE